MTNIDFGNMIVRLRKEKGMTQKQLAEKLNVSDKAVSRWENGKNYPDIETMMLLAEVLDISVNDLLRGKRSGFIIRKKHIVKAAVIIAAAAIVAVYFFVLFDRESRDYSQAWKIVTEEKVLNMSDDKLNALLEQKERIAVCGSEDNYKKLYDKFDVPYNLTVLGDGQDRLGISIEMVNHEDIYISEIIAVQVLAKNQDTVAYETDWLKDIMRIDRRELDFIPYEKQLEGKRLYIVFYNASESGFVQRTGAGIMSAAAMRKNIRDDGSVLDDCFVDLQLFCDSDFSLKSVRVKIKTQETEKCKILYASDAESVMNQEWIGFSGYGSIGNVAGLYENSWEMEPGKEERSGAYKMENYINLKKENGVNENYQIAWKLTDAVFKNDGKKYKMKNDIGLIMIIK